MLAKDAYIRTVRRPYPPLFFSLILMGYRNSDHFDPVLIEPFASKDLVIIDGVAYYGIADLERGGPLTLASWTDPVVFLRTKEVFAQRADALERASRESFAAFAAAYQAYMPALYLVLAVDRFVDEALRKALSEQLSPEAVDDLAHRLNTPLEDNTHKQELHDLLTCSDLAHHVAKYRWLNARYGDVKEYTVAEAREKLHATDRTAYLTREAEAKKVTAEAIAEAKRLLGDRAYLVDIFQYVIYYRTHRTDVMNRAQFLAIPMLRATAASLGLSYDELLYLTAQEVLQGMVPNRAVLAERMQSFALVLENGDVRCLHGTDAAAVKELFAEEEEVVQQVKGMPAAKGMARGKVRIVTLATDPTFQAGDVLVTSMTTPEMVPLMKRAVAFITDEGGVTCHAAILARELQKPCIIGTRIATRAFKNGDEVEVDATNGLVTLLKRN